MEAKVTRTLDAFFPGILGAVDFPEVLRLGRTPAIVAGARDAGGRLRGPVAARAAARAAG